MAFDTNMMMGDPFTQALLGLGGGLLQASGPSRIPVSMGQAMGQGLLGMQQGYGNAMQNKMAQMKMAEAQRAEEARKQMAGLIGTESTVTPAMISNQTQPNAPLFDQNQNMNMGILMGSGVPQDTVRPGTGLLGQASLSPEEKFIYKAASLGDPHAMASVGEIMKQKIANQGKGVDEVTQRLVMAGYRPGTPEFQDAMNRYLFKPQTATTINMAGDKAFDVGLGTQGAADIFKQRTAAQEAATSLQGIKEARVLMKGGMITGAFADYKVGLGKALQQGGINYNEDAIANTEAFTAAQAKQVASIIKAFGAGTGLSDADREFAMKAAGGNITMNEESIKRILDINERASTNAIKNYQKTLSSIKKESWPFDLNVEIPNQSLPNKPNDQYEYRTLPNGTVQRRKK